MKTFGDIKEGDYIYYYDHYKLHKQLVTKVDIQEKKDTYTDWNGNTTERVDKRVIIHAGRGTELNCNKWMLDYSSVRYWSMLRFADIEAYNNWISQRRGYLERRINYFKSKYDEYSNRLNKLNENNQEYLK